MPGTCAMCLLPLSLYDLRSLLTPHLASVIHIPTGIWPSTIWDIHKQWVESIGQQQSLQCFIPYFVSHVCIWSGNDFWTSRRIVFWSKIPFEGCVVNLFWIDQKKLRTISTRCQSTMGDCDHVSVFRFVHLLLFHIFWCNYLCSTWEQKMKLLNLWHT